VRNKKCERDPRAFNAPPIFTVITLINRQAVADTLDELRHLHPLRNAFQKNYIKKYSNFFNFIIFINFFIPATYFYGNLPWNMILITLCLVLITRVIRV